MAPSLGSCNASLKVMSALHHTYLRAADINLSSLRRLETIQIFIYLITVSGRTNGGVTEANQGANVMFNVT